MSPEQPKGPLGYHRVLAPSAGVKVSPLCLGAMNFGTAWEESMGKCSKQDAFAIMDAFYENGGNFIDTANNYQSEQSEEWIGDWMTARGNRDQMVIATKYTTGFRTAHFDREPIQSNYVGNSLKSLHISVNHSLRKLQTDYIDLLYVHWWDFTTSVEEVMHGLNALISAGKVLYLGVSDTPAWVVVKANAYARAHGLRPFSVYQGKWNALCRDMEREVIPMCRDQGMAIAAWAPLGQGRFKTAEAREAAHAGGGRSAQMNENETKVSETLEEVAKLRNTSLCAVALAYVLHKSPYVYPIIGQRKAEHLLANIEALNVELSRADMVKIDTAVSFDPGFPMNFIFQDTPYNLNLTAADVTYTRLSVHLHSPPHQQPVKPRQAT
ncbi:norsolorinic acid reductase [Aspergillus novofumigatus IBT 16806]|uniref:Norsolorinic acid reductase n=1 Tax=Aspergillus novofumigatus (strain IBT 16806) TaxID=1392255 RepID=A0A2I1C0U1_ASPN1|nr:norsolorinic acid reductase [Aspergillus novofumigatus IBT 16806]PKX91248.1 norsolorinic acid reductase [Aspergillus novofumigatus IBT 16806]